MESMTGYAYIEKSTHQFSFSIELKSLNSKFLEIFINLPKLLRKDENNLIQILKDRFKRGKIVLTIEIFDWIEERPVSLNKDIIKRLYTELREIEKDLKINNFFSGDSLFSFENVIQRGKNLLSSQSYNAILNALDKATDRAIRMRIKEGTAIKNDLQNSLNMISKNLIDIKKQYKDISKTLFNKLKKNIESLTETPVSDVRIYTEVAILSDRLDINEEVMRLTNHIKKLKSLMSDRGQIGKRLDFLAQEMFRETNTISAKANNSDVSHMVVNIKNHIDKIREHARNII